MQLNTKLANIPHKALSNGLTAPNDAEVRQAQYFFLHASTGLILLKQRYSGHFFIINTQKEM
jgi:hypothetical protein